MAPPRKSARDGSEDDPERANKTQNRAPRGDPERENSTRPRIPAPAADPERANKTLTRTPRPPPKRTESSEQEYRTGSNYGDAPEESSPGYDTGHNYEAINEGEEEVLSGNAQLDGDGLSALDPEVGTRTKSLASIEEDQAAEQGNNPDESLADEANATRAGPPMKLEIVAGPDSGKRKKFKGVRMVIGRTPGVDLQLSDQSVSRRHVELIVVDGGVLMRDLGSGNGTKVNGTKIAEKVLEHGDEIHIGKTKIRFVDEVAAFNKAREAAEQKEAEEKAAAEAEQAAAAEAAAEGTSGTNANLKGVSDPEADGEDAGGQVDEKTGITQRPTRSPVKTARGEEKKTPIERFRALNPRVRMLIIGFAALVIIIFIAGLVFKPAPPPPVDSARAVADQKMQDARNAVKSSDYETAVRLIDEAEKLVPGIDKTKLGAQARDELTFTQALEEARGMIAERRFDDARKALDRTGKGSGRNEEAKAHLKQDLDDAEVAYKKEKIDEFIIAGEIEAAKRTLNELPLDQQADGAAKILEFERQLAEQNKRDAADAHRVAANAAAVSKAHREQEIAEAFTVVERKFAGSEWDRAASECNRVVDDHQGDQDIFRRARAVQAAIPNFGRAYDEGMKKFRQGAVAQAARPLRQAWQLYGQIGLKANKFGQELEGKLGESALAAGREALLRDDLVTAYTNFRDATRFDPQDSKARAGLLEVESRAEVLFQDAYMQKDSDPKDALRKFKIVVLVTDANSATHEKAKNHIAALQP